MLKHGRIGLTRPESFPKDFTVYSQETETTARGRDRMGELQKKATAKCILSIARYDERMAYDQLGVKVTHTIIQRGKPIAKENDVFVLKKNGRYFMVKAVHSKGEMDIDTIYYCEERGDIKRAEL